MKKMIELHMNDGRVVSIDPEKVTAVLEHSTTGGSALLCDGGHKLIVQEKRAAVVGIITRGGGGQGTPTSDRAGRHGDRYGSGYGPRRDFGAGYLRR